MTRDPCACVERNVFVRPQRVFYSSNVTVEHGQLRQLLTCPSNDKLYYVSRDHIYCLDTETRKRTHIAQLPFRPSSVAAAHGWLCAGGLGEGGHFVAIKLPEEPGPRFRTVDGRVDPHGRREDIYLEADQPDGYSSLPYRMRHEQLGAHITNSVSIHRLPANDDCSEDEIVVVLTNNDHVVRVYSLTKNTDVTVDKYASPMNHASISPDGRTMFIVGDTQIAYFYERRSADVRDEIECPREWRFLRKIEMYKPRSAQNTAYFTTAWSNTGRLCATASEHGYITVFDTEYLRDPELDPIVAIVPSSRPNSTPGAIRAMSFSPEPWDLLIWTEGFGRMCVGDLRSGLNTRQVIDLDSTAEGVTLVDSTDALGAMEDSDSPDFESEIDFIRRHQRALGEPNNAAAVSFATDYLAHSAERRRLQREAGVPEIDDDPRGLTEQEQQILDGLRTTRQRQILDGLRAIRQRGSGSRDTQADAAANSQNHDPSRSSNLSSSAGRRGYSSRNHTIEQENLESRHENAVASSIRDYARPPRFEENISSLSMPSSHEIRRPNSVSLSSQNQPAERTSSPYGTSSAEPWYTIEAALRGALQSNSVNHSQALDEAALRRAVFPSRTSPSSNPNQTVHDSDGDSIPDLLPMLPSSSSLRASTRATLPNIRERAAYLEAESRRIQQLRTGNNTNEALTTRGEAMYARVERERERATGDVDTSSRLEPRGLGAFEASFLRQMHRATRPGARTSRTEAQSPDGVDDSSYPSDTWGVGTSGLCWGHGGSVVYVGTEKGIFELKLNFEERKFWPAVSLR